MTTTRQEQTMKQYRVSWWHKAGHLQATTVEAPTAAAAKAAVIVANTFGTVCVVSRVSSVKAA